MMKDGQSGEHVLVIDLGTGGPKVGLVDKEGRVAACTFAPVKLLLLPDGGAENDPAEWWSSIKNSIRKVLQESGASPKDIVAVGVTSYWGVTVPVDEKGNPLMNAMSWMDKRGARHNREIVKGFPNVQGYKLSLLLKYMDRHGFVPSSSDSLGHVLYIKHERPEIYKKTYKFFEPMDYVNMRLTGRFAATQNTMIPMLVVDNRQLDRTEYDPWLVKMSTIDPDKLPELLPIDGILGTLTAEAAAELGLEPGTTVVCGVQDNSTSAIGAGAIGDAEPAVTMGTSGHMSFHLPYRKSDLAHFMTAIPSAVKGSYLFFSDLENNGRVLDASLKLLLCPSDSLDPTAIPPEIYQRADRIASEVPPGAGGVIFHPWFNGSLSPDGDEYLRGGFLNLSNTTSRSHLMRAVFEGLSMNWRWLREPAEKLSGRKFQYWRLTGGGALSDVWAQIMADVVGIPMHRQVNPRIHNVVGMGLLTFSRLGKIKVEDIPAMVKFDRIFEPNPKYRAVYDEVYGHFSATREKLRPALHVMNKS